MGFKIMIKFFFTFILLTTTNYLFAVEKITGAGATFPYPLYSKWFAEYKKINSSVEFNYQSIGSGGGIKQVQAETVDFGATDTPMSKEELAKAKVPVLQIPTTLGGIVIAYNNSKIPNFLKLDGVVIAAIFSGTITKWNDIRIQNQNPNTKLPDEDILVVRRSDGSGTTANFTDYLSRISTDWETNFGKGKSIRWKTGIGAKGNEGVTAMVSQIEGSLGYVEMAFAINHGLKVASVKNAQNEYINPNVVTVSKAGESLDYKHGDFTASVINSSLKGAYPISSYTYILLPIKKKQNKNLTLFLKWALSHGQDFSASLQYAPLPKDLRAELIKEMN